MAKGKVKWFNAEKGFGFITPDGGGPDVFVHHSALPDNLRSLADGQPVDYEADTTPRGAKATAVKVIMES
jgi:cold shock protein